MNTLTFNGSPAISRRQWLKSTATRLICVAAIAPILSTYSSAKAADPTEIFVYAMNLSSPSKDIMMASVSGVVAKQSPEVFMTWLPPAAGNRNPKYWLDLYLADNPGTTTQYQTDPAFFVNKYTNSGNLKGYVLYDSASVNVATSIAGIHEAMMVDASTLSYATAAGLPMLADARGHDAAWVWSNYSSQLSRDMIINQNPSFTYQLRDYAVLNNAFMFYEPPAVHTYLAAQNDHSRLLGWASSEQGFFDAASQNNLMAVPADHMPPIAAMSKWDVPIPNQPNHASPAEDAAAGKHYVAFVMSDGDNVQFISNEFSRDARWWGSPHRGDFAMNWDLSPALADLNPVALKELYDGASTGDNPDFYVTAGGDGLTYPSRVPDLEGNMDVNEQAMERVDQNIISVLEYGDDYDLSAYQTMVERDQLLGLMVKTGSAYKGEDGRIDWHEGKPIVSVKYTLWDGFDTNASIVSALNSAPSDPQHNADSYTIVNVHPWSTGGLGDPMSNVDAIVQSLDSNVEVVALDELMIHLRNNFGAPVRADDTLFADNFETPGGGVPGWSNSGGLFEQVASGPGETYNGSWALKIDQSTTSDPGDPATWADWRSDTFTVTGSDEVELSFKYRTDPGAIGELFAQLRSFNDLNGFEGELNLQLTDTGGAWVEVDTTWLVPQGATVLDLRFSSIFAAFQGVILIDDIRVTSLGIAGDLDGDGFVGIADLNIVLGNWNQNVPPGDPLADPSGDNFIGIADLNIVLGNWNAGTPPAASANIPEPASLLFMSLCGMVIASRSRRLV
jgi:GxGYxYP putative glycoside hydrolase C-terminal domain/GxGYxYP_N second domain/GxGYxYP third domain